MTEATTPPTQNQQHPLLTLVFSGVMAAFCAAVAFHATGIAPSRFEPIGPGPVPLTLAILISVMSGIVFVQTLRYMVVNGLSMPLKRPDSSRVFILGLMLSYAAVLQLDFIRYDVVTAAFLLIGSIGLGGISPKQLAIAAVLSAALGYFLQLVFTRFLVVDLPGVF